MPSGLLRIEIAFFKQGRGEKLGDRDVHSLAQLVDDPQLYGVVGAIDDIAYGRFWNAAFDIELILRHPALAQKLGQSKADRPIQLHLITPPPRSVTVL